MRKILVPIIIAIFFIAYMSIGKEETENNNINVTTHEHTDMSNQSHEDLSPIQNEDGRTIKDRFSPPEGSSRIGVGENSFESYLRGLPLKTYDSKVLYYDGQIKENFGVYEAVVDMDIGKRNLQQCADAVMRLRGEYLFENGRFEKIHFNLTNGFKVGYENWTRGNRVMVEGNNTYWKKVAQPSNTYSDFRNYMDFVFCYAGTLSLSKELEPVELENMKIGDVFIQGGSPGHAVIVVDMAENSETGQKYYMLAQSYMPAQDIQVLSNPKDEDASPWYLFDSKDEIIRTPEWTFTKEDLKRFHD